jgi:hypothetical protein
MKKAIMFAALSMMGIFLFSSVAMAYDDLITNDTAAVKAAGGLCGSVSLLYTTASKSFDADGESGDLAENMTQIRVPLRANYGIMDKLTAFAILPIVSIDNGVDSNSGIGDLWLGAKYGIMPDGLLTVRGALDLPLGDDEKGLGNRGGFGIDVAAMSMKQIDKIGLNGQVGLRYNAEGPEKTVPSKYAPGIGIYVDVEGSYSFSEVLAGMVGIEFKTVGDGKSDGKDADKSGDNYVDLNVGACYKLGEKMGLRGDILYTLTGTRQPQNFGVLLKFGYAVK